MEEKTDFEADSTKLKERNVKTTEAEQNLDAFWPTVQEDVKRIKQVDARNQVLPLARIKKIMKLDENAKMIAAEAPLLFAKAAEIFIQELTLRAWIHTENFKRRTLQKNDIAMAITKCDQFDFLIDIVPREEVKPHMKKEQEPAKTVVATDQVQYYLHLAQQHQQSLQNTAQTTNVINSSIPIVNNTVQSNVNLSGPQNILFTTNQAGNSSATVNSIQNQQIQIMQQVVTPTAEVAHMPMTISQNQLNLLRIHMSGNAGNSGQQQVLIPTLQTQQGSIVQVNTNQQNGPGSIYLNTTQTTVDLDDKTNATNAFQTNC